MQQIQVERDGRSVTGIKCFNPRTLSDDELAKYYAMLVDFDDPIPINWQAELLRRFIARSGL